MKLRCLVASGKCLLYPSNMYFLVQQSIPSFL